MVCRKLFLRALFVASISFSIILNPFNIFTGKLFNAKALLSSSAISIALNKEYSDVSVASWSGKDYSFYLPSDGTVSLSLCNDLRDDGGWLIELCNENNDTLIYQNHYANTSQYISGRIGLPAGQYYLSITSLNINNINWNHPFSFVVEYSASSDWETELNDTINTADTITVNKTFHGSSLRTHNDDDWYAFSIPDNGLISVSFNSYSSELEYSNSSWNIKIYNELGSEILSESYEFGANGSSANVIGVPAGHYYVKVKPYNCSLNLTYQFIINYQTVDSWETEPNDYDDIADHLDLNSTVNGTFYYSSRDCYKLVIKNKTFIRLSLYVFPAIPSEGRCDIYIVSSDGYFIEVDSIYGSTLGQGGESVIYENAFDPDTYYIYISVQGGPFGIFPSDRSYKLSVSEVLIDNEPEENVDSDNAFGNDSSDSGNNNPDYNDPVEQDKPNDFQDYDFVVMHRLYNKWSGEHLYTADSSERDELVSIGWTSEGEGWVAPASGDPVYRLFNPYAPQGDHHYTLDKDEYDSLVKLGWSGEGVAWYSAGKDGRPLWRLFNPYATSCTHHYTTSLDERGKLMEIGWKAEGVAWYGL